MYLLFTWRVLRVSCQVRNVQFTSRIYSSQKICAKPQFIKPSEVIHLKTEYDVRPLSEETTAASNILLEKIRNTNEAKKNAKNLREIKLDTSNLGNYYLRLSKFRLTSLVVMTSMIGYVMSPAPFEIVSFLSCTVGTGLVSSAANSINQFLEIPFDAQMSRTRNRVLVQGLLTPLHALGFAAAAGSVGLVILYSGANALTATLGLSNLILYTMIYTPLKRISIINTWVGSVVGAIPPLMGWAACEGSLGSGAFVLGGILYAWQFPHFNALSWNLRPDYSKAGYRMMAVTNPDLCRRTALRYTLSITAFSSLAPVLNVTHWSFAVISLPINMYFVYLGFKFYNQSDSKNSRKLFRFSLLHLPILMALMLITKQGLFSSTSLPSISSNIEDLVSYSAEDHVGSLIRTFNAAGDGKQLSASTLPALSISAPLHAQIVR